LLEEIRDGWHKFLIHLRELESGIHLKMRLIVVIFRSREVGVGLLQLFKLGVDRGEGLLHTIFSYMRNMFDDNDVVHVIAPTGVAVFNVLGETLHICVGLDWRNTKKGMSNSTMEKLQKKLQNPVVILIDERSMLSQIILGLVEYVVARSAHECGYSGDEWGGIPVMILFGDDYQLPSIGNQGGTHIPQINKICSMKGMHYMTQYQGGLQIMNLAEEVMELDQVCRQTEDHVLFKDILECLRLGWMLEQDESRLRDSR
jgi:hypothetical protein